jgi:SAM-dependent methyltransferase
VTDRDEHRRAWDERHRDREIESDTPNPSLLVEAAALPPGNALDLACGAGTNAIWLARNGWRVTGVDWSEVALAKARSRADAAGVRVEWIEADLLDWQPTAAFDLVAVLYLHLPPGQRRSVYATAATAVGRGGHLLVVGHDRENLASGAGGPQDPERLFTAGELAGELRDTAPGLVIEKALTVRRVPPPGRGPIDALVLARRPGNRSSAGGV